jgi:hypothetical protein
MNLVLSRVARFYAPKKSSTAINLSDVDSASVVGKCGFVINGEKSSDYSGYSVSSAGDVNGDGLDDVIVGANRADPIKDLLHMHQ